jgi:hypothetical protein
MVQRITSIHAMAVAKKKPAETEGAKVPAAVDTMPDILLYLEKKDLLGRSGVKKVIPWTQVDIWDRILLIVIILIFLLLENHRVLYPGDKLIV